MFLLFFRLRSWLLNVMLSNWNKWALLKVKIANIHQFCYSIFPLSFRSKWNQIRQIDFLLLSIFFRDPLIKCTHTHTHTSLHWIVNDESIFDWGGRWLRWGGGWLAHLQQSCPIFLFTNAHNKRNPPKKLIPSSYLPNIHHQLSILLGYLSE